MKFISLLFLIFIGLNGSAQKIIRTEKVTNHSVHVIGDNFDGIIFSADYKTLYPVYDTTTYHKNSWYNPSNGDILVAETSLNKYLKFKSETHPKSSQAFVLSNLRKSKRQYTGYITPNGDRFIYINGFPDNGDWSEIFEAEKAGTHVPRWYADEISVMDGGPSFWQVVIDLKTGEVTIFMANGYA